MRSPDPRRRGARPATAAAAIVLAGLACGQATAQESGNFLSNLLNFGSTTVPPLAKPPVNDVLDCPPILVADGGAAVRVGANQLSIANVARECIERPGGGLSVKVGIEGRALLGPGSSAARFDVPLQIVIKRGDNVIATRTRRMSVAIPAGQAQASVSVVEGDIPVPPGVGEFDIEVGLGGRAAAPARRKRS